MFNLAKTFSVQNTRISRSTHALISVAQSCICGPTPLLSFISSKCANDKASTTCCSAGAPVLASAGAGASPCGLPAPVAAAALLAALLDATTWDATANFCFSEVALRRAQAAVPPATPPFWEPWLRNGLSTSAAAAVSIAATPSTTRLPFSRSPGVHMSYTRRLLSRRTVRQPSPSATSAGGRSAATEAGQGPESASLRQRTKPHETANLVQPEGCG